MTPRQIADQMIADRQREIMERNAYLRGEVAMQEKRLGKVQAKCGALELLPVELHAEYHRRKELEGRI